MCPAAGAHLSRTEPAGRTVLVVLDNNHSQSCNGLDCNDSWEESQDRRVVDSAAERTSEALKFYVRGCAFCRGHD